MSETIDGSSPPAGGFKLMPTPAQRGIAKGQRRSSSKSSTVTAGGSVSETADDEPKLKTNEPSEQDEAIPLVAVVSPIDPITVRCL
jgi:hypothetical protein